MAVITDIPVSGIVYPNQYVRVDRINIISKTEMIVDFGIYIQQSMTNYPPHAIQQVNMEFDLEDSSDLWSKAYTEGKKLWPMATDC